jgi:Flp pilus assembly protein TadD
MAECHFPGESALTSFALELTHAIEQIRAGEFTQAVASCQVILETLLPQGQVFNQQGCEAVYAGRYAEGIAQLFRAVAVHPDDPMFQSNLAFALERQGRQTEATATRTALAGAPASSFGSELHRVIAFLNNQQGAEAEFVCQRMLLTLPCQGNTLHELGYAAVMAGRMAQGIEFLRRAVAANPQDPTIHDNLAIALDAHGQHEQARAARVALTQPPLLTTSVGILSTLADWAQASGYEIRPITQQPYELPKTTSTMPPGTQQMVQQLAQESCLPAVAVCAENLRLVYWRWPPNARQPNGEEILMPLSRSNDIVWDPFWLRFYPFIKDIASDGKRCTVNATPFVTHHQHITEECFLMGGKDNFGHWFADFVSNLQAIESAHLPAGLPIITTPLNSWQRDSLNCMGFAQQLRELAAPTPAPSCTIVEFDRAWLAGDFAMHQRLRYLRKVFRENCRPSSAPESNPLPSRIYITRPPSSGHRIANEAEVCAFLKTRGFTILYGENLDIRGKAELFGQAEIVVSGPGTTPFNHFVFAQPGCILVTLWPRPVYESATTLSPNGKLIHEAYYHVTILDDCVFALGQPVSEAAYNGNLFPIDTPTHYPIDVLASAIDDAEMRSQQSRAQTSSLPHF